MLEERVMEPHQTFATTVCTILLVTGAAFPPVGVAQAPEGVAASEQSRERQHVGDEAATSTGVWYGYQSLGVDVAAMVLVPLPWLFDGVGSWSNAAVAGGILTYLLVPPAIHGWHGNETNAGTSFAVRAAVVAATGLSYLMSQTDIEDCDEDRRVDCPTPGFVWLFWLAGGTTALVDTIYARESGPQGQQSTQLSVRVVERGALLSVGGRF